ncbi:MAG: SDR family oxidoreductase [Actinomycetes bacterium]|jgi:2-deoxy-D-gluconate 3-dehydrogenase
MSYKELFDVRGKTALVTGARKGIGFAIASALAEHGVNLIVVSSQQTDNDELSKVAAKNGVTYTTFACDFRSRQDTLALVEKIKDIKIDILINNAGLANRAEALDHNDDLWDQTIEIDLTAPFILSREIGKGMAQRGYGKLIFIASMWSFLGGKNVISYTAAKTALAGLTRGLSNELLPLGITVNAIAPGFIETDITQAIRKDSERVNWITGRIPKGRWGQPADLAGAALFLSAPASDYVSGIVLAVDGGFLAN